MKNKPKKLMTLKDVKCSPEIKKQIRKFAREWIEWEIDHYNALHKGSWYEDPGKSFHRGSISMIETFCNLEEFPLLKKFNKYPTKNLKKFLKLNRNKSLSKK